MAYELTKDYSALSAICMFIDTWNKRATLAVTPSHRASAPLAGANFPSHWG